MSNLRAPPLDLLTRQRAHRFHKILSKIRVPLAKVSNLASGLRACTQIHVFEDLIKQVKLRANVTENTVL